MLKMIKNNLFVVLLILATTSLEAFTSPSQKVFDSVSQTKIEDAYQIRKIQRPDITVLEHIASNETEGFLGYHGDSIDFMIYQDIIKYVMEVIVEIPVREDFHFLAVPLDPSVKLQTKEDLRAVFTDEKFNEQMLTDSTLSLNFSLWDNYNRFGIHSIESYSKNEPIKPLGYQRRLKWLFNELGIAEKEIAALFNLAHTTLNGSKGVILQLFDRSPSLYAFSKDIAYPAYPNGFISKNVTVDEYFLDDHFTPPYPHEVRLLLNNETLNPNNPLEVIRHTPHLSENTLSNYQNQLQAKIKKLSFRKTKKKNYRAKLQKIWGLK